MSGLRSTFYRVALVTGSGLLVILAGWFENANDDRASAWSYALYVTAGAYGIDRTAARDTASSSLQAMVPGPTAGCFVRCRFS